MEKDYTYRRENNDGPRVPTERKDTGLFKLDHRKQEKSGTWVRVA